MGQSDVIKVLKKSRKWLIAKEIQERLDYKSNIENVRHSLNMLLKHGEVKKKKNYMKKMHRKIILWRIIL